MNKKILFLVISVLLCVVLIITGITVGQKSNQNENGSETPKPHVTLAPPKADTDQTAVESSSPETVPPPPYSGKTFTLLVPNSGELLLGDSMGGDTVSEAVYERNLAVCMETGVTMLFKYSLDVYADVEAGSLSGNTVPDLIMLNMRSDGSRFLMNGGLSDVSELYDTAFGIDSSFAESMSVAGRQYFVLGEVTPSYVLSRYCLKVKESSSLASSLAELSQNDTLNYEALFETLAENETQMYLDEQGLHALLSDGLFTLSANGVASVDCDGYVKRAEALSKYATHVNTKAAGNPKITVGTYSDSSYVYLPLPASGDDPVGPTVDASRLYPLALPFDCADREMSESILSLLIVHSEGLCELALTEYKLPNEARPVYCFYDVFGWGDFSRHAYKAFTGNKASSLQKTLEAPKRASLQALSILFERNS